jgi:uncharacterized protein YcbX
VVGDRLYAVRDEAGKFGSGKTTRRFRRMNGLFRFRAVYDSEMPLITFPDGVVLRGEDTAIRASLSAQLQMPVTLSREAEISHFDAGPLHLLTTASLRMLGGSLTEGALDARRFRPNILIETEASGFPEDDWQGHHLAVGTQVHLQVVGRTERCVMVNLAQDELPDDPHILRAVARANAVCLGVYADVLTPGAVRIGDCIGLL